MATVKKGLLTASGLWAKHLRKLKRMFWKRERGAAKAQIKKEAKNA